ncbi:hypothetical protein J2T12_005478 [Paenibacillus anaericanus]|nr:hypothetical protein [Paenibacillus anaericanus]
MMVGVYGSLGIYKSTLMYSIQTNKPILPKGEYEIKQIPIQSNTAMWRFPFVDYMLTEKAYSDKGVDKNYLLSYGGKLNPISKIYNLFIYDEVKRIMTLELQNRNGQLQLEHTRKSGQEYTKITWIKGSAKKTLLDVPGYINEFSTPSISLNNRYMIISSQIRGEHLAFVDATYYVFDLKTMSLIQKIKPHYKLYEYKIEWFNDELVRISYDTSRPNAYPPVYYHIPTQTSTVSRELLEYVSYLDNFTYEGLLSLDAPISLRVDNQYIRYSGNGPLLEKDRFFVPFLDFAGQQGITVDISATEIKLTKKDKQTSIDIKNVKKIGDVWYVPLRDLIPLNYKILEANDSYIIMETVKDGEIN